MSLRSASGLGKNRLRSACSFSFRVLASPVGVCSGGIEGSSGGLSPSFLAYLASLQTPSGWRDASSTYSLKVLRFTSLISYLFLSLTSRSLILSVSDLVRSYFLFSLRSWCTTSLISSNHHRVEYSDRLRHGTVLSISSYINVIRYSVYVSILPRESSW
jgi:hypothetical protein